MKDRKLPIGISIPMSLLEKIDRLRGKKSRSQFVVELLLEALERASA